MSAKKKSKERKIFVLDTSVIIHNHNAIYSFKDNDVAIPITVLEELDNFKKGHDTKNFEAREFIRIVDKLSLNHTLQEWIELDNGSEGRFKVIMHETNDQIDARKVFDSNKNDHRIVNAAITMQKANPNQQVVMVTKDINLRLKAKSLNVCTEDYEDGQVQDIEELYSGKTTLENVDPVAIDSLYKQGFCYPDEIGLKDPIPNHYYILKSDKSSVLVVYDPIAKQIERLEKRTANKITPRNAEQVFALHALTNPNIKLVTLQGVAGTGKTLLALAGALEQRKKFKQIYLARPIVPLSNKDIGFLPGDIKSKLNPYMEPLWDNLKFILNQYAEHDAEHQNIAKAVEQEKLVISPLAYIRGRSLSDIYFIVDEAQNLTPHEVKTIITRAGENTKIVFTGDINQIDTPYLDAHSNGLSYLIDRVQKHELYAHIRLEKGERSELANLANDLL